MNPLPLENLLIALGEIAAAFVGFSLVVGILRTRSAGSAKEALGFYSMRDVAEIGLVSVLASLFPLVIHACGASPDATWRIGSATFIAVGILAAGASLWRRGGWLVGLRAEPIQTAMTLPLQLGAIGLMLVNLLAGGPRSGARYVAAVLLALAVAGVLFVNTTFNDARDRLDA